MATPNIEITQVLLYGLPPIPGAPADDQISQLDAQALTEQANALVKKYRLYRWGRAHMHDHEIVALQLMRDEWVRRYDHWHNQATDKQVRAQVARHNGDVELREEIIEALVAEGKARHVAANLTRTETLMLAEGRRLGIL